MVRKVYVSLAVLVMLLVLAACAGGTPAPATPIATPTPPPAATPTPGQQPATPAVVDGIVIDGVTIFREGFPIVSEPITMSVFGQLGPTHAPWGDMEVWQVIMEKTGINLEFDMAPPGGGFAERKALMFAADDLPCILMRASLSAAEIARHGRDGSLLNIRYLLPEWMPYYYALMQEDPDIGIRITNLDGDIFSISDIVTVLAARTDKHFIKTTWLDAVGLPVPTTMDELTNALRAFRDHDHGPDLGIPFFPMGAVNIDNLLNNMAGTWGLQLQFGQRMSVYDNVVSTWIHSDQFKNMLMWFNYAFENRLLDPEIFTQDIPRWLAKTQSGRLGFFTVQTDGNHDSTQTMGLPVLPGFSDTLYKWAQVAARNPGTFALTTQARFPEAALRMVDWFFSPEGSTLVRFGVEGSTMEFIDGLPVYHDGILNHPDGHATAIGRFSFWPGAGAPQWINEINGIAVLSEATLRAQVALDPFIQPQILPPPLFDLDTAERLSILQGDIHTFMNHSVSQFIRGEMSFDEWDTYVATLYRIGIEEWVAIYQNVLDRLAAN
jgi:putative aldouronate transport system substrate-binding protein